MNQEQMRDYVTIEDEDGKEKQYSIEGLFDMMGESYALLQSHGETLLMRVENEGEEQYLVGISNPEERNALISAYEIALEAEPSEQKTP